MKVAFYKGTSRVFNKLVVWKTEGPYSHVEAVFGSACTQTGGYLCASASFTDGGVRFKEIVFDHEHWDIMEVPLNEAEVYDWFKAHEHEPYDVRGLVNFIIPVGHNPEGWFCDEAMGAAAGVPQPHRFDPTDLACIFERMGGVWIGDNIALNQLAA